MTITIQDILNKLMEPVGQLTHEGILYSHLARTESLGNDPVYREKLIVLGHAESEEPGMKYLAEWMRTMFQLFL